MQNRFLITATIALILGGCASGPSNKDYIAKHSPKWAMTNQISSERVTATGEGRARTATEAHSRAYDAARTELKVKVAQAISGTVRRVDTKKSWSEHKQVIEYQVDEPIRLMEMERSNERLLELPNGGYHSFIQLSIDPGKAAANELSSNRKMWRRLDQRGQDVR